MDLARVCNAIASGAIPLVRTDFSSDDAWQRVVQEISSESDLLGDGDGSTPNIEPSSDSALASVTAGGLANAWPREYHGYVVLADERSMREAELGSSLTVVLVDLSAADSDEEEFGWIFGQTFRCVAGEIAGIEANLSIANMDFAEFAGSVDEDGVFRGF